MILTEKNIEVFAANNYTNVLCASTEEFEEDFLRFLLCKRLAKKIKADKSDSIRLLCNHVICLTNSFQIDAVKEIFLFICDEEIEVIKTILNYLNFLSPGEWNQHKFCYNTVILLKEMDR